MPGWTTVHAWIHAAPALQNLLAAARKLAATAHVEEGKQILDDASTENMAAVQKADKRAGYRMQLAKCFDREQFGDKVQQDVNVKGVIVSTDSPGLARLMSGD